MALTRGSQRQKLMVNIQIELSVPILQGFIKLDDQICELNYRGAKSVIGDKVGDQFCNFSKNQGDSSEDSREDSRYARTSRKTSR